MSVSEFLEMYEGVDCYIRFPDQGFELYIPDIDHITSDNLKEVLDELWVVGFDMEESGVLTIDVNGSVTLRL